jgi:hypothetical protein
MHRNPVKRGLLLEPEQWEWSSYRSYGYQEKGRVKINQWPKAVMKVRAVAQVESQGSTVGTASPFAQTAKRAPPAASGKLADSAFGWRSGLPLRLGGNKIHRL